MTVNILTEPFGVSKLKGGCTGSSQSTLVKTPHYWKSRVAAHMRDKIKENSNEQEKSSIIRVWVGQKNPSLGITRDHRLSSLGKPRDAKRRSSGRIFLSYPHAHDRFLYGLCYTPDVDEGEQ